MATSTISLITGDPLIKTINLLKCNDSGEFPFNIPIGVDVTVAVISADHSRMLTNEIPVLSSETGSDWSQSKIVVNIPKTETETIDELGLAMLEIQVNDGNEITFFAAINIINGLII